jgi:hypothetical protein
MLYMMGGASSRADAIVVGDFLLFYAIPGYKYDDVLDRYVSQLIFLLLAMFEDQF